MKTNDSLELIEIIEIIDDEIDAFGDRPRIGTVHDVGGPRWVGPVAAAALVGLIGYGVATSTGDAPKAAPATSTSVSVATPTTEPAPPTLPAQQVVHHYAADPPPEFTVQYAESRQFANESGLVDYQLWATSGASATTGRWFSVTTSPGASTVYAPDSYRLQTGDLSIAISRTASGHSLAQLTTAGHVGVTIASIGWSDDDLLRLAPSILPNSAGVVFTDVWFTADHQMISSVQPWLAVRGLPVEQTAYAPSPDLDHALVVTVARPLPQTAGGDADNRQIALRFLLDRTTPLSVDGHSAVAGTVIGESNYSIATWTTDDNIVTVGAALPLSQLMAIARTVHEISAPQWAEVMLQAKAKKPGRVIVDETPALPVSFGTDANSETWTIDVSTATFGDQQWINWSWGAQKGATMPLDIAQINTVVDDQRTYVLADLPRAGAGAAELRVLRDGLDPQVVPFNDIDPSLDRTFAAYAFSETGQYTAQIVGPDGAVLATWPSS